MIPFYSKERILEIREAFGTQEEFAQKLGVTSTQVRRWEKGKAKPQKLARKAIQRVERWLKKEELL